MLQLRMPKPRKRAIASVVRETERVENAVAEFVGDSDHVFDGVEGGGGTEGGEGGEGGGGGEEG